MNNNSNNILFYSKYCDVCTRYIQMLSKTEFHKNIHFICIDKRVKENNQTYIILEDGKKIILPEHITKVPALMLITQGFKVLYGEQILHYIKNATKQEVKQATQNNMEPMAFSLGGGGSAIASDNYSFLDQSADELKADGNGGMRQMHNYVDLNFSDQQQQSQSQDSDMNTTIRGMKKDENANQIMEDRIKKMKEERDADIRSITGNRPPNSY